MFKINEIFRSIQGEGAQTGWPAIFIRFAGCNLKCDFCDTPEDLKGFLNVQELLDSIEILANGNKYLIVLTGGEPLIQLHSELALLCRKLYARKYPIQIETNGTIKAPHILNLCKYVTCSPKDEFESLKINKEMVTCWKIIFPCRFDLLPYKEYAFHCRVRNDVSFYLQPRDSGGIHTQGSQNFVRATVDRLKEWGLPWKLSLQTHKYIGER